MSPTTPRRRIARRSTVGTALTAVVALVGSVLLGVVAALPAQAHEGHGHVLIFTEDAAGDWHDAAIAQATPKVKTALEAAGMTVTVVHKETAGGSEAVFTDEGLAAFDAILVFQANGDPWNASEKAALERWQAQGNGIAAVHNALDMRGNYPWWDNMVGSLMPGHAPTGTDPGPSGVVRNEDTTHPSTKHFTGTEDVTRWTRNDEWYNFSNNVRGTAHVLQSMDESTYSGGNMGYDHPITWCKPYEGGRFWGTALGHFPSHYDEPEFMAELVGGVKYVAGLEEGDCGGTVWSNFERIPLDQNTSAPFAIDVADDGKVFYTELVRGQLRMYDPKSQAVTTVLSLPVYSGGEDGLLGVALDPDFSTNGHIFLYRSAESPDNANPDNFWSTVSRFTFENGSVDPASEKVIIKIPARRLPDEPGHTGGGLDIDDKGNLFIGVGDDVNPHSEPSGGYAPLSERAGTFHDARATSANTNDLRGKILRINPVDEPGQPGIGSSYTVPDGNLFPEAEDAGRDKTLPEIYAMGFRNPFRFSIDNETGWLSMADYSPDNGTDAPATRGPAGIAEWNLIKSAGNYGWPLCMGGNHQGQNPNGEPFRDVDYGSTTPLNPPVVGDYFDCANPVNDSSRNTGLTNLPPARAADMYYGYRRSSVGAIPQGGGLAPMGGPVYRYDAELESDTKFPKSYDGKPFFYDWARNKMFNIQLKNPAAAQGTQVEKVNPFLPDVPFLAPIDSKFGPDGSMYVLDWGGGYGRDNPTSGLYRIDYISGSRSPVARIDAEPDSGQAPLEVTFDGSASTDPEDEDLTYAWDFDGDGTTDATGVTATHTYTENGVFNARLTVTDPADKSGTTTVPITVGNTRPVVDLETPPNGAFFDFGDEISWDVKVTDPEEETVDPQAVEVQPALGHRNARARCTADADARLMADAERVSVVVPVRNGARTLPLCLPALLAQRFPPDRFEILCVDNGSTDESVALMQQFAPRVQILCARKRGASAARNEGVRHARYPWVAFTDCDCIPEPDWLAALMRFARGHGRADLMGGRIVAFRPTTAVERFSERLFDQQRALCEFKPPYAVSANMLASRDTLAALGEFDEAFLRGQDVELSYRAFFAGRATFGYVDDAVVAHVNPKTLGALWSKALQHGEAAANIVAKYGELLGDTAWRRCSDWRRYRSIARLAAQAAAGVARQRSGTSELGHERLCELIVAAGKQAGFVRRTLSMRLGSAAAR